jgi:hypothetical protein
MDSTVKLLVLSLGIGLAIIMSYFILFSPQEKEVPLQQFLGNIVSAKSVSIVMDVRGSATPEQKIAIMQCATDLAASQVFVGKKLVNYAYDESGCVFGEANLSKPIPLSKCDELWKGTLSFIVKSAPGTRIYAGRMEIGVANRTACKFESR